MRFKDKLSFISKIKIKTKFIVIRVVILNIKLL